MQAYEITAVLWKIEREVNGDEVNRILVHEVVVGPADTEARGRAKLAVLESSGAE